MINDGSEQLVKNLSIEAAPATAAEIREYLGFHAERHGYEHAVIRTLGFLDAIIPNE